MLLGSLKVGRPHILAIYSISYLLLALLVMPRGFEPTVAGVKGPYPRPLDDGTISYKTHHFFKNSSNLKIKYYLLFVSFLYKYYNIKFLKNQIYVMG